MSIFSKVEDAIVEAGSISNESAGSKASSSVKFPFMDLNTNTVVCWYSEEEVTKAIQGMKCRYVVTFIPEMAKQFGINSAKA